MDALYERLREEGHEILIDLRDEVWGQRHFSVRDPSGGLLDDVKPIPPSTEYQAAYLQGEGNS